MAKYTEEVKAQAVEAAKSGMSLKQVQSDIGPNPKAVMRYLKAVGIDYKELKASLKESGDLKESTNAQGKEKVKRARKKASKQEAVQAEEVIEE